jgi:hypothetical protein
MLEVAGESKIQKHCAAAKLHGKLKQIQSQIWICWLFLKVRIQIWRKIKKNI